MSSLVSEIKTLRRKLDKYVSDPESGDARENAEGAEQALSILQALSRVDMTVELLAASKVGKTVTKLRKHENREVAALSKSLVKRWRSAASSTMNATPVAETHGRQDINEANGNTSLPVLEKKESGNNNSAADVHVRSTTNASLEADKASHTVKQQDEVSQEKAERNHAADKSAWDALAPMRRTCCQKFYEILVLDSPDDAMAVDAATTVERAMAIAFDMGFASERKKEYLAKFRQLHFNLKKNVELRADVLCASVSGPQLVSMSPEELATADRRRELNKLKDEGLQKSRSDWDRAYEAEINKQCGIKSNEGLFKCGRCKSRHTTNNQKQTRSADEPMTVFVECLDCGNRWKT